MSTRRRSPHVSMTSRRHLIGAAASGGLLGSAWGLAFRDASTHDESPAITVCWHPDGTAALVEYRRRRVLMLDASEAPSQRRLTELVTGFMRQRIDMLLATDTTLSTLPTTFRQRWKITTLKSVDPDTRHPQISSTDTAFQVGGMTLTVRGTSMNAWSRALPNRSSWYVTLDHGPTRVLFSTTAPATLASHTDDATLTAAVITDADISEVPPGVAHATVVAPAEAPLFDRDDSEAQSGTRLIRLHRDLPQTYLLHTEGVGLQ